MSDSTINKDIVKVVYDAYDKVSDILAVEEPIEIIINAPTYNPPVINKNISITMRTPIHDKELAVGFLFTEGILSKRSQVNTITQDDNRITVHLNNSMPIDLTKIERHFYTSSSCGICGKSSLEAIKTVCLLTLVDTRFQVTSELIKSLPEKLDSHQSIFKNTGGIHAAALFDKDGTLAILKEDIGRHNALDKVIGAAFLEEADSSLKLPLNEKLLLLSGRASFELVQKSVMAGIRFIMSVGAPSSLAVQLAEEHNITLIGFLNRNRFNIYTGCKRIKF